MNPEFSVKLKKVFVFVFLICLMPGMLCAAEHELQLIKRFYSIATASINGTYYPVGNSIARALSKNMRSIVAIAEPTAGSVANIDYLKAGQVDLALVQSDVVWQAVKGSGMFAENRFPELKVLASLYSEVLQIVVKKSSGINSLHDLKGRKISVGDKESGSAVNVIQLMAAAGLRQDDYQLVYERFTKATESLKDGYVDAVYYTGGVPADGISRLAASVNLKLIAIPLEVQKKLVEEFPYYSAEIIAAGSYDGQINEVPTVGLRALLVATERLNNEDALKFLSIIYKDSLEIAAQNLASNLFVREDGLKGVDASMLHFAAQKFFQRSK
jgi:TRAP transporter TAXI family solute receptor